MGSLALVGIPFFAGFYSKDMIFGILVTSGSTFYFIFFLVLVIAACLTSAYTANMLNLIFFGFRRSPLNQIFRGSLSGRVDLFGFAAILILSIPAVVGGWSIKQVFPWL